jgi:hypothetical protein
MFMFFFGALSWRDRAFSSHNWSPATGPAPLQGQLDQTMPPASSVCAMEDVSAFVWSHRGHVEPDEHGYTDGSLQALKVLLDNGIINFDIDISSFDGQFYVAHPSAAVSFESRQQWKSAFCTVNEFLNAIAHHEMVAPRLRKSVARKPVNAALPMVSVEPKFVNTSTMKHFVDVLYSPSDYPRDRLAIITNSPGQYEMVETYLRSKQTTVKKIAVSRAYRSLPKTADEFSWERDAINSSQTRIRSRLHMPDVKLLSDQFRKQNYRHQLKDDLIVSWLVDDAEGLKTAIDQGIDGVISNHPMLLKNMLEYWHLRLC